MVNIIINPGSGPVENGKLDEAEANIAYFIEDLDLNVPELIPIRIPLLDKNGRFGFVLANITGGLTCAIEMPGVPLEDVRYFEGDGDPWQFPRLYVNGSSWLWCYALSSARRVLLGEVD